MKVFHLFTSSLLLAVTSLSLCLAPVATQAATTVDPSLSSMGADKTNVKADGIESVQISVTIKNQNFLPLENVLVTLTSSRGNVDEISALNAQTDILGKARFRVRSLRNGVATFSASALGIVIQKTATVTFEQGLIGPFKVGDLIKIPDDGDVKTLNDTAVYYYASNGRRYVFPNEKVYFTWYPDFSKVKVITIEQMSLIPIGGNVTYKPGTRLVKFQTDPKTYIVTRGGVLRWATSEEVARGWFGPNWNQYVDDITEAFYVNYKFGEPVQSYLDLALDIVRAGTQTIDQDKGLGQ